ncbi:MAG: hypothetical protein LAT79_17575 [Kiritimatiellae bacterium]|nr:hypothetical protein [Kiritimatiellia bacterium]
MKTVSIQQTTPVKTETIRFPDFYKRARKIWGKTWTGTSTDALIRETRGEQ